MSVFIQELATEKFVHFNPEARAYLLLAGDVGACLFAEHLFEPFVLQQLKGDPKLFRKIPLPPDVIIVKGTEKDTYAKLRAEGYNWD